MKSFQFDDAFVPFPTLVTPRLTLREITMQDVDDIYEIFSDPLVTKHYDVHTFTSRTQARDMVRFFIDRYNKGQGIRWGITQTGEDRVIGTIGINYIAADSWRAEVGYELGSAWWRQGIMREALGEMIRFGFEEVGFHRIEALVEPDNLPSLALLDSLGFQREGSLRDFMHFKESYRTLVMCSLLASEYDHT